MPYGERTSTKMRSFAASFPPDMPLDQKILLTVFFACSAGQNRPIKETHMELAALCGMELADYFEHLLELRIVGIITDEGYEHGLLINRDVIQNAKIIDELAARAAKRVQGRLSR